MAFGHRQQSRQTELVALGAHVLWGQLESRESIKMTLGSHRMWEGEGKLKVIVSRRHLLHLVDGSTVHSAKIQNQPRCPSSGEWTKKMRCGDTMEYYSAMKKARGPEKQGLGFSPV